MRHAVVGGMRLWTMAHFLGDVDAMTEAWRHENSIVDVDFHKMLLQIAAICGRHHTNVNCNAGGSLKHCASFISVQHRSAAGGHFRKRSS